MLLIAVPTAVIGALSMGLASAAQAHATKQVTTAGALDPRLLFELAKRKLWWIGVGGTVAGLVLQLVALNFGPLILVQPILITALLFATLFAAWLGHHQVDRVLVVGAILCCGGLATFLTLANPTAGSAVPQDANAPLPVAGLLALVLLGLVLLSRKLEHRFKVLPLALATGLAYGMTAALMKVVVGQLHSGVAAMFTHPVLYLTCVLGPIGFLLSQNTFQEGKLVSPALAVITTTDPLVGVLLGMLWFGEEVSTAPLTMAFQLVAGVAVVGGIMLLARRAHHLSDLEEAEAEAHTQVSTTIQARSEARS